LNTMRILLLEQATDRPDSLAERLEAVECHVVARALDAREFEKSLDRHDCDILVLDLVERDAALIQQVGQMGQRNNLPVAVFVEETDIGTIHAAVEAGISSYIVRGSQRERLRDALEVARARFASERALRDDLASARSTLADRKVIERAKGRLMKEQCLDEEAAYSALRAFAMRRNTKIIDVARSILAGSRVL